MLHMQHNCGAWSDGAVLISGVSCIAFWVFVYVSLSHLLHCADTPLCCCALQDSPSPDVWLQLLERCAEELGCQPTALRSLAQQLAEQRRLSEHRLAQQKVQREQQLTEQRVLNVQQQKQLAYLQAELIAQQQVVAEQGARIAALEAQMQQFLQRQP
jgi:hypothetical protein